jgi:hypothetical protein
MPPVKVSTAGLAFGNIALKDSSKYTKAGYVIIFNATILCL